MRQGIGSMALAIALAAASCSESSDASHSCPEGMTHQLSTGTSFVAETRDEAVAHWLPGEGLEASDDAIAAGVVAAQPGSEAGTEVVQVETTDGSAEVRIVLEPQDPGWRVAGATWCLPAE
jgi:hypothetical protein